MVTHFDDDMTRFGFYFSAALLLVSLGAAPGEAAATNEPLDFKEVYDLVHAHLAGTSDAELNRAAVEGLLTGLRGKVRLVTGEATPASANAALVSKASVLDDGIGYVRVGRVAEGLAKEVSASSQQLGATNKLKGLVLDLRFADGDDYAAAAAAADLFTAKEQPLLDWGSSAVKSKAKTDALSLPLAVLVNRETGGAAEALAAVLRQTGAALLLGGTTAGRAMIAQEFPLKNGQRLSIATTPVKLGDDTALSAEGVKPDIEVAVNADEERVYFKDAYAVLSETNLPAGSGLLSGGSTNRAELAVRQPRLSEAELMREKREGITGIAAPALDREAEPEKPVIRDPALARGVDLLKGLALVRRSRS